MKNIDWSEIQEHADISNAESKRLDSPSGQNCPECAKEMMVGEDENWGVCFQCCEFPFGGGPNEMQTVQEKFQIYHAANPDVYKLFLRYASEVRAAGFTKYSAWAIMNRIRWHHDINTKKTGGFKISNDYIAWYARRAMTDYPTHFKGFFKIKQLSRA